jgi:predicted amidohydrolase
MNETEPQADYDLLIYVANWPEVRSHIWKTLLMARAIENQSYVAGMNRIGEDGNKLRYSGDSMVVDFKGLILSKTGSGEQRSETILLSHEELITFRKSFPAGMDADSFILE